MKPGQRQNSASATSEVAYLRHVQTAFLPKTCPTCRHVRIFAHSVMQGGVGGDFYDFPEVANGLLDALGGAKAGIGRLSEILADTRGQEPKVQLEAVFEEVYSPGRSTEGRRTDDASAFLLDLKS